MRLIYFILLFILIIPVVLAVVSLSTVTITSPANESSTDIGDTFTYTCETVTTGNGGGIDITINWSYCAGTGCTPNLLLTSGTSDLTGDDADGLFTWTGVKGTQAESQIITGNVDGDYVLQCRGFDENAVFVDSGGIWITVNPDLPPNASIPKPANNTQVEKLTRIVLNVTYWDPEAAVGNVTFYNSSNNLAWCTNLSVTNGSVVGCGIDVGLGTEIKWYVNTTDGVTNVYNGIWNFSIPTNNAPTVVLKSPANDTLINNGTIVLNVTYSDADGEAGTVTFFNAVGNSTICTNTSVASGTDVKCDISVAFGTQYKWSVNVTDGFETTASSIWNFSTTPRVSELWVYNLTETDQVGNYNLTNVFVNATDGNFNFTKSNITFNTTSGAVGDPSTNFSIWNGSDWIDSFDSGELITFRCTPTQTNCEPENQDAGSSQSIYKVCNNGTGNGNTVNMSVNETFLNIALKCDDDYTSAGATTLSSTNNLTIHGTLASAACVFISCWVDYTSPTSGGFFDTFAFVQT